jgi:hypothetical protein
MGGNRRLGVLLDGLIPAGPQHPVAGGPETPPNCVIFRL